MNFAHVFLLAAVLAVTAMNTASSQEPEFVAQLDGTWKSDWKRTKRHIDADCKLTEEEIAGLQLLMGKMTVRYNGPRVTFTMPKFRFEKDGKTRVVDGWTSEETLKVIGRTPSQIALLFDAVDWIIDEDSITLINFEDADTYWVYLGFLPLVGHHVREYFRRVSKE